MTVCHIVPFVTNCIRKYKSLQTVCLKLLVKQNSASVEVVDPVVELIGRIAIRRDSLKSLLLDNVWMDPHPGRKKKRDTQSVIKYLLLSIERRVNINPLSIKLKYVQL